MLLGDHTQRRVSGLISPPPHSCRLAAFHRFLSSLPLFAHSLQPFLDISFHQPVPSFTFSAESYFSPARLIPQWLCIYWLPPFFTVPLPVSLSPAASISPPFLLLILLLNISLLLPLLLLSSSLSLSVCFSGWIAALCLAEVRWQVCHAAACVCTDYGWKLNKL